MNGKLTVIIFFLLSLLLVACGQEDAIDEMKQIVPIYSGAKILTTSMPTAEISIIQLEVDASNSSEDDIIDFYKETMDNKGWGLGEFKRYKNNGSLMSFEKDGLGTFSIQIITKTTKKTGKMKMVLNLTKMKA